jgi:hypothetical protein
LSNGRKDLTQVEIDEDARWLKMERTDPSGCRALLFCNFSSTEAKPAQDASEWTLALSTSPGPGCRASLYIAKS